MFDLLRNAANSIYTEIENHSDLRKIAHNNTSISGFVRTLLSALKDIDGTLPTNPDLFNDDNARKLLAAIQQAESSAYFLSEQLILTAQQNNQIASVCTNISAWVKNKIIPWISKMWSSAWSIITSLVTPKEWKLKGGLGTSVLGLANVGIEVTFG